MTREELQTLIDRVIGTKGIMRSPAWWVRRVFYEIVKSIGDIEHILDQINGEEK